jgi:valyl-tRNA synthetase
MLAPYPRAEEFPADAAAERDMASIQAIILGVRRIRGEMNISPARRVPLLLQEGSAEGALIIERHRALIERLAGLESVRLLAPGEPAPQAALALAGTLRLLVPMAGLIDVAAEIERLEKLLAKARTELGKTEAQLGNENFVRNAPAEVVAAARERAAEFVRTSASLGAQLARLRGRPEP